MIYIGAFDNRLKPIEDGCFIYEDVSNIEVYTEYDYDGMSNISSQTYSSKEDWIESFTLHYSFNKKKSFFIIETFIEKLPTTFTEFQNIIKEELPELWL